MNISVILCTYNRCQQLAKALNSIAASNIPEPLTWEVLVVDNRSSDETREIVNDYVRRYPDRFRYVFEGHQGKSHALNTGIQEARGDLLAFVDDDVIVDSNWLCNLVLPLMQGEWGGTGGRVFPERDLVLPNWIRRDSPLIVGPLVIFDLGPNNAPLKEAPFGTNMAFRKTLFAKHGGFRTDLGPRPGSELRGEDSELIRRFMHAGERLYYVPSAIVYHSVSEHRLTREYFLAWWFDKGRSDVRTLGSIFRTNSSAFGIPLVLFRRLTVWLLKWTVGLEPSRRFTAKLTAWYLAGEIVEFYRESQKHDASSELNSYSHEHDRMTATAILETRRIQD
jgi:glucosyl-dolichyl phosphate glucuronosyltransferase